MHWGQTFIDAVAVAMGAEAYTTLKDEQNERRARPPRIEWEELNQDSQIVPAHVQDDDTAEHEFCARVAFDVGLWADSPILSFGMAREFLRALRVVATTGSGLRFEVTTIRLYGQRPLSEGHRCVIRVFAIVPITDELFTAHTILTTGASGTMTDPVGNNPEPGI